MRNTLAVAVVLFASLAVRADVVLTAEAPGVQASQVSGVVTESFEGLAVGQYLGLNTAVGRLSALPGSGSGFNIKLADAYGGAGGSGHYFVTGLSNGSGGSDAHLSFGAAGPQSYLGLWLSALDAQNRIELYSGGSVVASFNAATVNAFLPSAYDFNPNQPLIFQGQPYVYLNFIATGGTTFDAVDFNEFPGGGLELDNLSIRSSPLSQPYSGTIIPGGVTSVPTPSALAAALLPLAFFMAIRKRRRG